MSTPAENLHETSIHEFLATDEAHGADHHHATPFGVMTWVFAILLVLTVLTVFTAKYVDLTTVGNLLLALTIAVVKALLVVAFFMHLKYDKGMNMVVAGATVFALVLFLGLTLIDMDSRAIVDLKEHGEITEGGFKHFQAPREGDYTRVMDATPGQGLGPVAAAQQAGHAADTNPDAHAPDAHAPESPPADGEHAPSADH